MKITIEFNDDEIHKLQGVYDVFNAVKNAMNDEEPETETGSDTESERKHRYMTQYSQRYLDVNGLTELAKTEFFQGSQTPAIQKFIERVRTGSIVLGNEKDELIKRVNPQAVAATNCNLNARIMVANNFLAKNNIGCYDFPNAWEKILRNEGTLPGKVNSCNSDLYRAMLSDLLPFTVETERQQSGFVKFITSRPNKLIRVWTTSATGTHATMLFYDGDDVHCIDTGVKNRNGLVNIDNLTELHGRKIDHLETLE